MNKYTAAALTEAARNEGRRILVLGQRASRDVFPEFLPFAQDAARVVRTNGNERIRYANGGEIIVRDPTTHGHRGIAVDTVYLDGDTDRLIDPLTIAPCIATSQRGEIIRA